MVMPNRTYELRNLYFQQSSYKNEKPKYSVPSLMQWPENEYFSSLKQDTELMDNALMPEDTYSTGSISQQVFGNHVKQQYLSLKHAGNLFYERCRLHDRHIKDINHRHLEIQKKKFGVEINNSGDMAKRLSNLESQLLQLESQKRDEQLAFWKDTVELREKLFENADSYRQAKQRIDIFSDVEGQYGGPFI